MQCERGVTRGHEGECERHGGWISCSPQHRSGGARGSNETTDDAHGLFPIMSNTGHSTRVPGLRQHGRHHLMQKLHFREVRMSLHAREIDEIRSLLTWVLSWPWQLYSIGKLT